MSTENSLSPTLSTIEIAQRGEAIFKDKYQAAFESKFDGKFVAINIQNEDATVADSGEEAVRRALEKEPSGLFHLIRVGHKAAFEAGWNISCAS